MFSLSPSFFSTPAFSLTSTPELFHAAPTAPAASTTAKPARGSLLHRRGPSDATRCPDPLPFVRPNSMAGGAPAGAAPSTTGGRTGLLLPLRRASLLLRMAPPPPRGPGRRMACMEALRLGADARATRDHPRRSPRVHLSSPTHGRRRRMGQAPSMASAGSGNQPSTPSSPPLPRPGASSACHERAGGARVAGASLAATRAPPDAAVLDGGAHRRQGRLLCSLLCPSLSSSSVPCCSLPSRGSVWDIQDAPYILAEHRVQGAPVASRSVFRTPLQEFFLEMLPGGSYTGSRCAWS